MIKTLVILVILAWLVVFGLVLALISTLDDLCEYEKKIKRAIEYIEENQEKQYAMNYEYGLTYNELPKLLDILKGEDKE